MIILLEQKVITYGHFNGNTKFAPIHVADIVDIIHNLIVGENKNLVLECIGPEVLTFKDIIQKLLNSIGFLPEQSARAKIYKGKGCDQCSGSGYKGRMGIYEILEIDNELKAGVLSNLQQTELNMIAKKNGFRTMQDMGQDLLLSGDLSFAEYERVLQSN